MPSSVNVSGQRVYQPGIYAEIDASALGGSGISTGNVAVVGAFPSFEAKVPTVFASARRLAEFDITDATLALIAKLAFAPSKDDAVPGGAASVTMVNVQPNTQAQVIVADANAADALTLKAKRWGTKGNRTYFKIAANEDDAEALDVTLVYNGITETFTGLKSGDVATLQYTGTGLTSVALKWSPTQFRITWTKALTAKTGGVDLVVNGPGDMWTNGALSFSLAAGGGSPHAAAVTIKTEGIDKATGALVSGGETKSFAIGTNSGTTTHEFSRIDKFTVATSDNAWVGVVTVSGTAIDVDPRDYNSVAELLGVVAQRAAQNFEVDVIHPRAGSIPAGEVDLVATATDMKTAEVTIKADLWAILQGLATSQIVTASRASGGQLPPVEVEGFLSGGTETSPVTTQHWIDALAKITHRDVQIVVPMSQALAVHKAAITHCNQAALAGYERNVWVGITPGLSLDTALSTFTGKLNSRYVAAVGQRVKVDLPSGAVSWLDPEYLALILAAMQAGTPVGTPLTRKRPDVVDVSQAWDPEADVNLAIPKGLCVLGRDVLGWRVERSVSTYLTDDNPIFSEVSAFESAQTSVRALRSTLNVKIGQSTRGVTANQVTGTVAAALDQQVADGIIKAWRALQVEDLGDRFRVNYELAAIEPLNFIQIAASVVRIAA